MRAVVVVGQLVVPEGAAVVVGPEVVVVGPAVEAGAAWVSGS